MSGSKIYIEVSGLTPNLEVTGLTAHISHTYANAPRRQFHLQANSKVHVIKQTELSWDRVSGSDADCETAA